MQSYLKLYTLININGNHIEEKNGVLTYLGQRVLLQDKGLLLSVALPHSNNASPNNILSLSVLHNQIKMSYGNKVMDFTPLPYRITLWAFKDKAHSIKLKR
ncbi:hypothetical protein ACMAWI_04010 [Helicobacter pylori]